MSLPRYTSIGRGWWDEWPWTRPTPPSMSRWAKATWSRPTSFPQFDPPVQRDHREIAGFPARPGPIGYLVGGVPGQAGKQVDAGSRGARRPPGRDAGRARPAG